MENQSWTAIVLTCRNKHNAYAYQKELETRQLKGMISTNALVLTVEDPKARIGSGGATLNALLVITEHLSAKAGHTVVTSDVLKEARILIMHMGRCYPYDACGRAFVTLPLRRHDSVQSPDSLVCNLDYLYDLMTASVAAGSPPGVWVCSTDMMLTITFTGQPVMDWKCLGQPEVIAFTMPAEYEDACQHGVYNIDSEGFIRDILYQKSGELLRCHARADHKYNLAVGLAFFNIRVTEKLLSFHAMTPLDCCTYIGIDRGAQAIELSLFFDILYAMCSGSNGSNDSWSHRYSLCTAEDGSSMHHAWGLLKKHLGGVRAKAVSLENGQFHYLGNSAGSLERALSSYGSSAAGAGSSYSYSSIVHGICETGADKESEVLNSYIGKDVSLGHAVGLVHCSLNGHVAIGSRTWLKGVELDATQGTRKIVLGDDLIVQKISIRMKNADAPALDVYVLTGRTDDIQSTNPTQFCNQQLTDFYERTGLTREYLWPATPPGESTLLNAKLYPVLHPTSRITLSDILWMQSSSSGTRSRVCPQQLDKWKASWRFSLEEILAMVDLDAEFGWRQQVFVKTAHELIARTLLHGKQQSLTSLYAAICAEKDSYAQDTLVMLDNVASTCCSPGVAARTLANIADLLGSMAAGSGGLRSGPAANAAWQIGFGLLEDNRIAEGVAALAAERRKWLKRPDHLIRAARHYEGAAQILIRHAVMSARQFVKPTPSGKMSPFGEWIVGESPVRIDIAGGWSDTPPITYEHGGAVTNAAILVDGKRPVGARVRRIEEPHIVLMTSSGGDSSKLVIKEMQQLEDYYQPQAPGALVKAALFCADVLTTRDGGDDDHVSADSSLDDPLRIQLLTKYSGGFELHTWSNLPQGSGLGTSSILAGVVMAVLWKVTGQGYTEEDIVHAVLHLEQMLTTGGGWQDQVGGLLGGIKIGESDASLPLHVSSRILNTPPGFLKAFNDRLVLVYTGRTRLAKNLLQNVVRNWYARDEYIVKAQDELVRVAHRCAEAFEKGDLKEVGLCWELYWVLKKQLATGCEPEAVSRMMAALRPHVHSAVLAGAGGGGFMYVLTMEPDGLNTVRRVLSEASMMPESVSLHKAEVSLEGLRIYAEPGATS